MEPLFPESLSQPGLALCERRAGPGSQIPDPALKARQTVKDKRKGPHRSGGESGKDGGKPPFLHLSQKGQGQVKISSGSKASFYRVFLELLLDQDKISPGLVWKGKPHKQSHIM